MIMGAWGLGRGKPIVFQDGTVFDVEVDAAQMLTLQPKLCVSIEATQTYQISWGDGDVTTHVVHKTYTGADENPTHVYAKAGKYRISFTDSFSNFSFSSLETSSGVDSRIVHIEKIGDSVSYAPVYRSGAWRYFARDLKRLVSVAFKNVAIEAGNYSFGGCTSLVQYGDNGDLLATSFGYMVFNETAISSFGDIPNATTMNTSFRSMPNLTRIGAVPNVTQLTGDVFYNTRAMVRSGPWPATPPTASRANSIPVTGKILIPRGSYSAYAAASVWSNAASRLEEVDV